MIALGEAFAWLASRLHRLEAETVRPAAGRVLAEAIPGGPAEKLAAIDGYAVRAAETEGASEYAPLPVGGAPIVAGAPLPPGADAVLPLHLLDAGPVALGPIPPGHGVEPPDTAELPAGTRLRPPHLALLARRGHDRISVVRKPTVALHVAGPKHGPDALTAMLVSLIEAEGGQLSASRPDLVLHAGRSGPGPDDEGIARLDTVFAHGIAIRPGETTGLGLARGVPCLLLPGDPLACATVFALLAAPALRRLGARPEPSPVAAVLTRKITSGLGQLEAVRVRVEDGRATPLSTLLSAGAGADGLVLAPEGSEGYPAGATVPVHPLP